MSGIKMMPPYSSSRSREETGKMEPFGNVRKIILLPSALIILQCTGCKPYYGENWRKVSLINATVMMPGEAKREHGIPANPSQKMARNS